MKIDIFNHIFPRKFFDKYIDKGSGGKDIGKRVANIQTIVDVDARLRILDEFGDYVQVISLPLPPLEIMAGPEKSPQLAREANDGLAQLVHQYDRFLGFAAALPMNNPDAALAEIGRAVDELGAFGIQLYTNVAGKPLDAPEFMPLFEEVARRGVPIWLHPARGADFSDYLTESKSQYEIWWTFGWPYETSVAMARLVFSGYFDRFPDLEVITHHMGGMIPYFEGRVGYGWDQLGKRTSDVDYVSLLKSMKKRPVDYFKSFYADTALFGAAPATRCGLEFFGVDRVVFASDMPFEPTPGLYARETIRCVEALDLPQEQKARIYRGNAEKLLKL
ncbi:MAG TPA: amidohydrolase family protein [Vicinamibacterales bacterium]|nr:amidohydrolase family protein [Vicinamibacterales bacterium]